MNKGSLYRYSGIIIILLIISHKSWGSVTLPQLSDTIPVVKKTVVVEQQQPEQPVKEIITPVIKEIPRSKKQLKPIALPPVVPVKVVPIVKPKIVIKKIGVRIP